MVGEGPPGRTAAWANFSVAGVMSGISGLLSGKVWDQVRPTA